MQEYLIYVTSDITKLAFNKGFPRNIWSGDENVPHTLIFPENEEFENPIAQEIEQWLIKKHKVHIIYKPFIKDEKIYWQLISLFDLDNNIEYYFGDELCDDNDRYIFNSSEEVILFGIEEALNFI